MPAAHNRCTGENGCSRGTAVYSQIIFIVGLALVLQQLLGPIVVLAWHDTGISERGIGRAGRQKLRIKRAE